MTSGIPDSQDYDIFSSQEDGVPPAPKRARQNGYGEAGNRYINSPYKSWETWDSDKVCQKLTEAGYEDIGIKFKVEDIDGSLLPDIDENRLEKIGVTKIGERMRIKKFLDGIMLETVADSRKVFNDPIHGHIDLHPLCVRIIDTPEFQRLRFLKQLGNCYFVYPGASHNRFEHCIGVCYLAGQLVRAIQKRQPSLNITEKDVLCVEIAGLCHDLGHGPFSHLFDGKFIPHIRPDSKWKHEDASRDMFHYLMNKHNLQEVFNQYDLFENDIKFIVEQVTGPKTHSLADGKWPYEGRSREKSFLYEIMLMDRTKSSVKEHDNSENFPMETDMHLNDLDDFQIVANKRNGIDVDKWDYFARDCHMLGIRNNFDHNRCIQFARVLEVEGEKQICSRDKEVGNLYDMFHTRNTLHRRAYQHRVTNIVDTMVAEAMILANDHIFFKGSTGKPLRMSEAIDDMRAFSQLTDNVFFQILHSTENDPKLVEAREILKNILERKLYKCVGQTQLKPERLVKKEEECNVKREILSKCDKDELESSPLSEKDVILHVAYLDYGMKDKNPIDKVRFYSKDNPAVAKRVRKDQVSQMLPETFAEQQLRIYCKKRDPRTLQMVGNAFSLWCKEKDHPQPKGGDVNALELTPLQRKVTEGSQTPNNSSEKSSRNTTPNSAGRFKSRLSFD